MDMKKIIKLFTIAVLAIACTPELHPVGGGVAVGDGETVFPVIYLDDWGATRSGMVGDTIRISPVVTPADKCTFKWTLDDAVISENLGLEYELQEEGVFTLAFKVSLGGETTERTSQLTVRPRPVEEPPFEPDPFTPKAYNRKAIAFFDTALGDTTKISWDWITHLVLTAATFQADGSIAYPYDGDTKALRNLVNTAHHHGVYVMLQYAGQHDPIQGKHVWNSMNFYNVAIDDEKGPALAEQMVEHAQENGLDGISISMDKAISSSVGYPEADKLVSFYEKLHGLRPESSKTGNGFFYSFCTITGALVTNHSLDPFATMEGWDWIYTMVFGVEMTFNTSLASQDVVKSDLQYWLNAGIAKEKLIVTIPAIVGCFDSSPLGGAAVTDSNVSQCFTWIPWYQIFTLVEDTAANITQKNNYTKIGNYQWIRYDGFPWINTKFGYLTTPGAGGMALWKLNFDSNTEEESMMYFIHGKLGN